MKFKPLNDYILVSHKNAEEKTAAVQNPIPLDRAKRK